MPGLAVVVALATLASAACGDGPEPADAVDAADASGGGSDVPTTPDVPNPVPPGPDPEAQQALLAVPETADGRALTGLSAPVHVVYTEHGVPHLYAETREDLGRALGYVVARDRFFIMDLQRRLVLGEVSGLLGDLGLPTDLDSRGTGMRYVAERLCAGLDPDDAAYVDAYADGINQYLAAAKAGEAPLPSEIDQLGALIAPSGTDPADLMAPFDRLGLCAMTTVIMYQTSFEAGDVGRGAKALASTPEALTEAFAGAPAAELRVAGVIEDLVGRMDVPYPFDSTPGWGRFVGGEQVGGDVGTEAAGARAVTLPRQWRVERGLAERASARADALSARLGRKWAGDFGSNTWAVTAAAAADGRALVAGDGHLPLYVPSLMYQVGMDTRVFGGGDVHQAGLVITSLPILGVGTNGHIAWSQVNPVADITDWYREELQLDGDGRLEASAFEGAWRPLVRRDETYTVAEVTFLGSAGGEVTWARYETFDGRFVWDVEGTELDPEADGFDEAVVAAGDALLNLSGRLVVPGDVDGDGVVSGISFDYAAFDATRYMGAVEDFTHATSVEELQEATKGLVGNMLYMAAADQKGDVLFTSYQGVPCRSNLPRGEDGEWLPGANPLRLLDGTVYGGFTVPTGPDGKVDEAAGATDPSQCVVPFDATPQAISPPEGFVVGANNPPAPIHSVRGDGLLGDDPHYIGGPWVGVRGHHIARDLEQAVAEGWADEDGMARIQGNQNSPTGEKAVPALLEALDAAEAAPGDTPLGALWAGNAARFEEARDRLAGWVEAGYAADSGVATFYETPGDAERANAVATMIHNAWLPRAMAGLFGDETEAGLARAFRFRASRWQAFDRLLRGRGAGNPEDLASFDAATGESAFWDVRQTERVEPSEEVLCQALADALDYLSGPSAGAGRGGFETEDMDQWLWGLRHQVRFESVMADFIPPDPLLEAALAPFNITTETLPLADDLPLGDPRRELVWFPRPGDNYTVDAASHGFSGTDFTYASGPVMRMVISLGDGEVRGRNIVPGGQSGLTDSPHFADQAERWLGNTTVPLLFHPDDVAAAATGREVFSPAD